MLDQPTFYLSLSFSGRVFEIRESLSAVTQTLPDLLPRLPSMAGYVTDLRDDLNLTFIQFRVVGLVLTVGASLAALLVGRAAGDPLAAGDDRDRTRKLIGEDFVFLTSLEPSRAEAWDRGARIQDAPSPSLNQRRGLSAGVWLELLICVALDGAGCLSYFSPNGEVADAGFAFVSAFILETLFGWPELAIFNFWEELLPLSDVIPTATIGWSLVVLGFANDPSNPKGSRRKVWRPPPSDLRSYAPPEPHLREGNREWLPPPK